MFIIMILMAMVLDSETLEVAVIATVVQASKVHQVMEFQVDLEALQVAMEFQVDLEALQAAMEFQVVLGALQAAMESQAATEFQGVIQEVTEMQLAQNLMFITIQVAVLAVTVQENNIMMQDFKASKDSDIVQVAMTQMLNKLEAVLLMVLHSVAQDMILVVPQHMLDHSKVMDKILEDMVDHLELQVHRHMLDHSEELILEGMDRILEDTDKISVHKVMILVHKGVMILELQDTPKVVKISVPQVMVAMMQMHNKSEEAMDHLEPQGLEMVDGKCHQATGQQIYTKELTAIQ